MSDQDQPHQLTRRSLLKRGLLATGVATVGVRGIYDMVTDFFQLMGNEAVTSNGDYDEAINAIKSKIASYTDPNNSELQEKSLSYRAFKELWKQLDSKAVQEAMEPKGIVQAQTYLTAAEKEYPNPRFLGELIELSCTDSMLHPKSELRNFRLKVIDAVSAVSKESALMHSQTRSEEASPVAR